MDMVENVARAMAENAGFKWENCTQPQWMSDARAGIAAMREPTEEMVNATGLWNGAAASFWREMIDVILADKRGMGE